MEATSPTTLGLSACIHFRFGTERASPHRGEMMAAVLDGWSARRHVVRGEADGVLSQEELATGGAAGGYTGACVHPKLSRKASGGFGEQDDV